ncbi:MAG: serine/threonine-protein phosphatase [Myxococcales bacterium]|nr:serine/threonine-protein phosphatase [Myxococcales bacterium]
MTSGPAGDVDTMLRAELDKLGLAAQGVPSPEQWAHFLSRIRALLHDHVARIGALEEMAAYSTEELARMRLTLSRQYKDVGETLESLGKAVSVFHDASEQGDEAALNEALRMAQQRFNLQLSSEWFETPISDDPNALEGGSSIRVIQQNLLALSRSLAELVKGASTLASSRKELELAGAVQQMLVPPDEGVAVPGARIQSWFQPAADCGGDWWTAHELTESQGLVVVGDVTGHGAPSAIITGAVKGACDLARMGMRGELKPSQLMRMLNRVIVEAARGEYMMTGVALTLQPGEPRIQLTNAGHHPPWLIRNGEITVLQGVREPPLGAQAIVAYTEVNVAAEPGDILVLLTDGITEAENEQGQELGEKVVRSLCETYAQHGAQAVRDKVREAVHRHTGSRRPADDITLVVIEVV